MFRRLGRALMRRCPNCGSSGIFDSWLNLAERCPRCRHRFERDEGYWLGAIALNTGATIVGFAAVFVASMVALWPDPPWTAISAITIGFTAIFPIAFHPYSRTIWVAIELGMNPVAHQGTLPITRQRPPEAR